MLRRLAVWNRGAFRARRSVQAEGRTERGHHHRRGAGRALSHVFFEARRDRGRFRRLWLCRSFSANRSFFLFSILIFGRGSRTRSSLFVISLSLCSLVSVSSTHRKKKTARDALLPLAACPRASPLRRAVRPTRGRTGQRLRRREAKEKSFLPSLDVPPPLAPPLRLRRAPLLGLKGRPSGALSGRRICRRRGRPNETSEKERARQ